mmetsp:Transcript_5135/g.8239  ORF Transcript_5135/g.8239 Transcript_5135/m.8239 type:complete len:269 (-) Transcript_5135:4772-5578(-)
MAERIRASTCLARHLRRRTFLSTNRRTLMTTRQHFVASLVAHLACARSTTGFGTSSFVLTRPFAFLNTRRTHIMAGTRTAAVRTPNRTPFDARLATHTCMAILRARMPTYEFPSTFRLADHVLDDILGVITELFSILRFLCCCLLILFHSAVAALSAARVATRESTTACFKALFAPCFAAELGDFPAGDFQKMPTPCHCILDFVYAVNLSRCRCLVTCHVSHRVAARQHDGCNRHFTWPTRVAAQKRARMIVWTYFDIPETRARLGAV